MPVWSVHHRLTFDRGARAVRTSKSFTDDQVLSFGCKMSSSAWIAMETWWTKIIKNMFQWNLNKQVWLVDVLCEVNRFLDEFLTARIGTDILSSQYLSITRHRRGMDRLEYCVHPTSLPFKQSGGSVQCLGVPKQCRLSSRKRKEMQNLRRGILKRIMGILKGSWWGACKEQALLLDFTWILSLRARSPETTSTSQMFSHFSKPWKQFYSIIRIQAALGLPIWTFAAQHLVKKGIIKEW